MVSPTVLYKLLVPLLRCEVTDMRDSVVLALGTINHVAIMDLMSEVSVVSRCCKDVNSSGPPWLGLGAHLFLTNFLSFNRLIKQWVTDVEIMPGIMPDLIFMPAALSSYSIKVIPLMCMPPNQYSYHYIVWQAYIPPTVPLIDEWLMTDNKMEKPNIMPSISI